MATFALMMAHPDPRVPIAVTAHYPGQHFKWTDSLYFLSTTDTAMEIGDKLGVKRLTDDGGVDNVAIVRVGTSYWGWGPQEMWSFLQRSLEAPN